MQRRRQVGAERGELERGSLDTDDLERDVGAVGERVDRGIRRRRVATQPAPEVAQQPRGRQLEPRGAHEVQREGVADLQTEPVGEHEARGRLVDTPGIGLATVDHRPPFDRRAELVVLGDDREEVDGPDAPAVAGLAGEHQADRRPRLLADLREPLHLVEVDRAGEPTLAEHERAVAADEDVGRVLGADELGVRPRRPLCTGQQPEHHATPETGDERDPEPRRPPAAHFGPPSDEHRCQPCSFIVRRSRPARRSCPAKGNRAPKSSGTRHHGAQWREPGDRVR